ncbi:hypothetical protein EDB87DRAFT_1776446 [Lactarius vividus]|nr:hypothetical protein EDB87DRAFT_1776446 [Lactarius vividus]
MEQSGSLRTRGHTTSGKSHETCPTDSLSEINNTSHTPEQHRKKRPRKSMNDSADPGPVTPPSKRPTRSSSGSGRPRGQSIPALDPDAYPGEDLDPTIVTMAAICEDTGQGRVSSKAAQVLDNHAAWKRSNKEKRARMRATMEAKKYGRGEDMEERSTSTAAVEGPPSVATPPIAVTPNRLTHDLPGASAPDDVPESEYGFDYDHAMATSRFNVQVRIGPNGETIVDEESLFVDRAEEHETDNYVHVEESDATKFVNSGSYSKKFRGTRWTAEETELFYAALSQFGENYELISYVLPGRDRKACKAKFKTEDKKNSHRINHSLKNRVPYDLDIQMLSKMTGKDFSGPVPVIHSKAQPTLEPTNPETEDVALSAVRKQSRTPGPAEPPKETGAEAETGKVSTRQAAKAVTSAAPYKGKKSANDLTQEDVEVLGTIDGDWD